MTSNIGIPGSMSTALSGMRAAQTQLGVAAHNVANAQTPGFKRQELASQASADSAGVQTSVRQSDTPGPSLETDVVSQLQAKNAFLANLAVFKTSNRMAGALLDEKT